MQFHIFDLFSQTAAQICFKFCVHVSLMGPYQVIKMRYGVLSLNFHGIFDIFVQILANSKKSSLNQLPEFIHNYLVWRVPKDPSF